MYKWGKYLVLATILFAVTLACSTPDIFVAQATVTSTRTPRPTFTPFPDATDTPVPTVTVTRAPTVVPTKSPTARPTTRPASSVAKSSAPPPAQSSVSSYEFHVNPATCEHSGLTFIKGIVYLDRNDPSQRYQQAIVALGPPDGTMIYATVLSEWDGNYTFVLSEPGQPRPGNWGVWLVTPSMKRKSDIGGPIATNNLGPDKPGSCWAGHVDFWK